jgi:NAD(P)-dependent dehydrogenase (short-subunit alcohol dehydrogenase family)
MASTPSRAVLITGCSTGIGRETARRLARQSTFPFMDLEKEAAPLATGGGPVR